MAQPLTRAAIVVALLSASATSGCRVNIDAEQNVSVDVRFRLTDLDYRPIPRQQVRIVVGSSAGWQAATAGERFTTDDAGEHRYRTQTPLEKIQRKRPTNYVDSLLSQPQPTDHLQQDPMLWTLDIAFKRSPPPVVR